MLASRLASSMGQRHFVVAATMNANANPNVPTSIPIIQINDIPCVPGTALLFQGVVFNSIVVFSNAEPCSSLLAKIQLPFVTQQL